ncbi:hypothetical protein [Citrobacter freundii]|uniref:hypothetical protein n=1 Tax=Citrobacter freundii TaxID=546 RepID=UPI0015C426B9|nr:hypothetical protein [Citrobacter freundii]NWO39839.1 hypothetical protein [Citrobacter freundii]
MPSPSGLCRGCSGCQRLHEAAENPARQQYGDQQGRKAQQQKDQAAREDAGEHEHGGKDPQ